MRALSSIANTDPPSADYPNGRIRTKDLSAIPPIQGTPVIEALYGDMVQFFQKMLQISGLTANGNPDNETNDYQTIQALLGTILSQLTASDADMDNAIADDFYVTPLKFIRPFDLNIGGGFILEKDGSDINVDYAVANYQKIGKMIIMNFVASVDVNSSQAFIAFKASSDASAYNSIASGYKVPLWHAGVIKNEGGVPQVGIGLLNNNALFGIKFYKHDGSNFAIGSNHYFNFTFTYFLP